MSTEFERLGRIEVALLSGLKQDTCVMSSRTIYRLRVLSIVGSAFGLSISVAPTSAAIERVDVGALSVGEKLSEIREAMSVVLDQTHENDAEAAHKKLDETFTAQWFNWGNWRNWANWANWANYFRNF